MAMRPSECLAEVGPCCGEPQSPKKLTKPQKRRRRMQLLAEQRGRQSAHKDTKDSAGAEPESLASLNVKADTLGIMMQQMLMMLSSNSHQVQPNWGPCVGDFAQEVNGQPPEELRSNLRAEAEEFVPQLSSLFSPREDREAEDIEAAKPAIFEQLPEAMVPDQTCTRCGEFLERCICDDIICTSCFHTVKDCQCTSPRWRTVVCSQCKWEQKHPSLHEETPVEQPWVPSSICPGCESIDLHPGVWNFITPSEHTCGACHRLDAQRSIRACDGNGCKSELLFHEWCMTAVDYPMEASKNRHEKAFLCSSCISEGNAITVSDIDSSSETSHVHAEKDGTGGLPEHASLEAMWTAEEATVWYRVTSRLVQNCATLADATKLIDERWDLAKAKLSDELRAVFQYGTDEMRCAVMKGFENQS